MQSPHRKDSVTGDSERPQVSAWIEQPDGGAEPLLLAMGRALWAFSGLERMLLVEYARLALDEHGVGPEVSNELSRLETLPAGAVRKALQRFGLPEQLEARLAAAIEGRNNLIHHQIEDPELVRAAVTGDGREGVVSRIERLSLDCVELAVELAAFALPRLEAKLGTREQLVRLMGSIDPASVEDESMRRQLESVQALSHELVDFDLGDLEAQ